MKSYKTIQVNGKQVRVHRYLMEQKLGRKLGYNEIVHHIDHNIHNNNLDNLEVVSRSEHMKIHPEILQKSIEKNSYVFDIENIIKMYETMSISDISKYFNVAPMTIWSRLKEAGVKTTKLNTTDIEEIFELINQKVKQRDIAKKYGVSEQLISNIKNNKRYGNK